MSSVSDLHSAQFSLYKHLSFVTYHCRSSLSYSSLFISAKARRVAAVLHVESGYANVFYGGPNLTRQVLQKLDSGLDSGLDAGLILGLEFGLTHMQETDVMHVQERQGECCGMQEEANTRLREL